jgi:hypothetical protein
MRHPFTCATLRWNSSSNVHWLPQRNESRTYVTVNCDNMVPALHHEHFT